MAQKVPSAIKGFKDKYPAEKAQQDWLFHKLTEVIKSFGYSSYDGPLIEPIDLYLNKSSEELVREQTFGLVDRDGRKLVLRPEMTPTLARMVAARAMELVIPLRWFNIGLRYRYEAPQKGRSREFYQIDCDLIGPDSRIADAEIISIAALLLRALGVTPQEAVVYVNSRSSMKDFFKANGISDDLQKPILTIIDRMEKQPVEISHKAILDLGVDRQVVDKILNIDPNDAPIPPDIGECLSYCKSYGVADYIEYNPRIVRGLDYYTGIVFEVKARHGLTRSLYGGGRYNNLITSYGANRDLPGVGFATSDVILLAFLQDLGKLPDFKGTSTIILAPLFENEDPAYVFGWCQDLRKEGMAVETYPEQAPLSKQLTYAQKAGIPFVLIAGEKGTQRW
ncbi:MAG: Histidine--tRNA ligase [Microgenomates bacterium OLB22]|nr:MAG: Histidine--tRNA ligase [Microgenomates bacterium OLB22]